MLNIFNTKLTLIADVYRKLRIRKTWLNEYLKNIGVKPLLKPEPHHLHHSYLSFLRQIRWKKSPLVISKILGPFVKTLNAAHKYSMLYREKPTKLIQTQLSQKQKLFFQFVATFLKSRLI